MPSPILPISNHPSSSAPPPKTVVKVKIDVVPSTTLRISSQFEPDKAITPLLHRVSSYNSTSGLNNNSNSPRQSISREVGLAAADTFLLSRLCVKLFCYLVQVCRNIIYGENPRNRLDLYLPKSNHCTKPVVAFITGGAWIIGYKVWGSLLGQQLSESDIIVACIDYRNFPQGTISAMVEDASQGISFVEYGGDPNRIYLMAACALINQAIKEAS
ncbi:probable isoprenylcysteine alpha-carbonyl methylesterase ICMEL1 [Hibiscus syriacus]|uniref:probable isoprenylcysteine alpha-carbonyl methylesterase ICMEL1 n=1 Tax=Hibiscus syriacus TaxID=106335 RepID=UPI0019243675|nr:probable isoprenylcysteine alpha-carbonyl methylesterase ICMEL1 [Hibiscus syriacus]